MKKIFSFVTAIMVTSISLMSATIAQASDDVTYTDVTVRIVNPTTGTIYDDTVYVPSDGCVVTDSDGVEHDITSPTALCALDLAALYGGFTYEVVYSSFGLYLSTIADQSSEGFDYWSFYVNYQYATNGLADYVVSSGENIILSYGEYGNVPLKLHVRKKQVLPGQIITAVVKAADDMGVLQPVEGAIVNFGSTAVTTDASGYANYTVESNTSDLEIAASYGTYTQSDVAVVRTAKKHHTLQMVGKNKRSKRADRAIEYLEKQVDDDGLVSGSQALTEWTAMALISIEETNAAITQAVKEYQPTTEDGVNEISRNLLARVALGLPTDQQVQELKGTVQDGYVGTEDYINEEVFFILALQAAEVPFTYDGYAIALNQIAEGVNDDGGISYAKDGSSDVDTTAYLLQALNAVRGSADVTGVNTKTMRRDALYYLKNQQNVNGGWGYSEHQISNASSTAVVLQALKSSGLKPGRQIRNQRNGYNFLNRMQRASGAVQYNTVGDQSLEELNTAYSVLSWVHSYMPVE